MNSITNSYQNALGIENFKSPLNKADVIRGVVVLEGDVNALISCLKNPNTNIESKNSSIEVLGEIVKKRGSFCTTILDELYFFLNNSSQPYVMKKKTSLILGDIALSDQTIASDALDKLHNCVQNPKADYHTKISAIEAIGEVAASNQLSAKQAIESLIECLKTYSSDSSVKIHAVNSLIKAEKLGQILPENVVTSIFELFKNSSTDLPGKKRTIYSLFEVAKIGQKFAKEVKKCLIECLEDPNTDSSAKKCIAESVSEIARNSQTAPNSLVEGSATSPAKKSIEDILNESTVSGHTFLKETVTPLILCILNPNVDLPSKKAAATGLRNIAKTEQLITEHNKKIINEFLRNYKTNKSNIKYNIGTLSTLASIEETVTKAVIENIYKRLEDSNDKPITIEITTEILNEIAKDELIFTKVLSNEMIERLYDRSVSSTEKNCLVPALCKVATDKHSNSKHALTNLIAFLNSTEANASSQLTLVNMFKSIIIKDRRSEDGLHAFRALITYLKFSNQNCQTQLIAAKFLSCNKFFVQHFPTELIKGLIEFIVNTPDDFQEKHIIIDTLNHFGNDEDLYNKIFIEELSTYIENSHGYTPTKKFAIRALVQHANPRKKYYLKAIRGIIAFITDSEIPSSVKSPIIDKLIYSIRRISFNITNEEVKPLDGNITKKGMDGLVKLITKNYCKKDATESKAYELLRVILNCGENFTNEMVDDLITCLKEPSFNHQTKTYAALLLSKNVSCGGVFSDSAKKSIFECLRDPNVDFSSKGCAAFLIGKLSLHDWVIPGEVIEDMVACYSESGDAYHTKTDIAIAIKNLVKSGYAPSKEILEVFISYAKFPDGDNYSRVAAATVLSEAAKSGEILTLEAKMAIFECFNCTSSTIYNTYHVKITEAVKDLAESGQTLPSGALKLLIAYINESKLHLNAMTNIIKAITAVVKNGDVVAKKVERAILSLIENTPSNYLKIELELLLKNFLENH